MGNPLSATHYPANDNKLGISMRHICIVRESEIWECQSDYFSCLVSRHQSLVSGVCWVKVNRGSAKVCKFKVRKSFKMMCLAQLEINNRLMCASKVIAVANPWSRVNEHFSIKSKKCLLSLLNLIIMTQCIKRVLM